MPNLSGSKRNAIHIHMNDGTPTTTLVDDEQMGSFAYDEHGVYYTATVYEEAFTNRGGVRVRNFTSEVRRIPWTSISNYVTVVKGQEQVI